MFRRPFPIPRSVALPAAAVLGIAKRLNAAVEVRATRATHRATMTLSVVQVIAWRPPWTMRHHVLDHLWTGPWTAAAGSGAVPFVDLCAAAGGNYGGGPRMYAPSGGATGGDAPFPPGLGPGPPGPGVKGTKGSASSLPHPDKMRARLVNKDGRWRDDVDWPTIEQELKRAVAAFVDLVNKIKHLALSVEDKDVDTFMLNYNDFWKKAVDALQPTAKDKQEYLLRCAKDAAAQQDRSSSAPVIVRDGRYFVASTTAYAEIADRSIRIDEALATLPMVDESERDVSALPSGGVVTVLSGESGSGKSTALLTCIPKSAVGVYVTSRDLLDTCNQKLGEMVPAERNAFVQTTLCTVVAELLGSVAPNLAAFEGPLPLTVALDEMSSLPAFVRGLCACHDAKRSLCHPTLAVELGRLMGLRNCTPSVTVVVAGTGVDALAAAPGSLPGTFRVVQMAMTTDRMLKHLVSHLKRLQLRTQRNDEVHSRTPQAVLASGKRLAQAVERNAAVVQLCRNPRFAAALYEFAKQNFVGLYSDRAADAFVQLLVPGAAFRYKQLNGMQEAGEEQVRQRYEAALKLVFSGAPASIRDSDAKLVRSLGVLTDRARWISATNLPQSMDGRVELARDTGTDHILLSPTPRFVMSGAQQQLFRMHYGFRALPDSTWMGYEDSVADYLFAALLGCHGRTLGYLLKAMSPKSQYVAKMDEALLKRPLNYAGVRRFDTLSAAAAVTISAASTEDQLADLAACMRANKAVVVVNAPRAPYADVVVMIPKVAVLLVQCKFYRNSSRLDAGEEVTKMRDATALLGTALLDKTDCTAAIPVIVTTKAGVREDGTFVLWETSKDESLAPLGTPMPSHGSRSDELQPKRELVSEQATTSPSAEVEQQTIVV